VGLRPAKQPDLMIHQHRNRWRFGTTIQSIRLECHGKLQIKQIGSAHDAASKPSQSQCGKAADRWRIKFLSLAMTID
jgi:hypothetical protein